MAAHRPGFYFMIIATVLLFLADLIIYGLAEFSDEIEILPTSETDITRMYPVFVDFNPWTQILLIVVTIYQFFWIGYGVSTLFRTHTKTGGYLYYSPPYMPVTIYAMHSVTLMSHMAWVFAYTYGFIGMALGFKFLVVFTSMMSIYYSATAVLVHTPDLMKSGQIQEVYVVRALLHNGIGIYYGYHFMTMLINLAKVMVYRFGISQETAAITVYVILIIVILLSIILEATVFDRNERHLVTPYIAYLAIMIGIFAQNFDPNYWDIYCYLMLGALVVSAFTLLAKMILMCVRGRIVVPVPRRNKPMSMRK